MDLGLRDRVFVVTGGSSGLGRAGAEALVGEGARVVLSGRDGQRLAEARTALSADSGVDRVTTVTADNAGPDTADRLVAASLDTWGRIDGALVSVGGPPPVAANDATDEQWRAAFESVFLGAARLVRAVAGSAGSEAAIALVLSTSVRQPIPGLGISNGLRPGLAMLAKTMADELGPRGVRVVGLLPGRFDTERARQLDEGADDPEAARSARLAGVPLRRDGQPAEFGRVAAFVLSPAASFVTGTMVTVDGGATRAL